MPLRGVVSYGNSARGYLYTPAKATVPVTPPATIAQLWSYSVQAFHVKIKHATMTWIAQINTEANTM